MRLSGFRWMAWWYSAIAVAFLLLAISRAIAGEKLWLIGIRLVISVGFAILAAFEFKASRKRN
ncbi:MAG: hypothetical protein JOY85_13985 [Acidobacteriaceae bacterium]|nr:hypothetical protein [Acidobacteriaceae bacterium]